MMPTPAQRFTRHRPCPACGGHADLPSGRGVRCWGYLDDTGSFARCTREEHGGNLAQNPDGTFSHRLDGPCICGLPHASGAVAVGGAAAPPLRVLRPPSTGVTLAQLASAKGLPIDFLAGLGWHDSFHMETAAPAVCVPYRGIGGELLFERKRLALESKGKRFHQPYGIELQPYGLDRLGDAIRVGRITLVEGESDAATCWFHGEPALGLPGKNSWKPEWASYLKDITQVRLWVETDAKALARQVATSVPGLQVVEA